MIKKRRHTYHSDTNTVELEANGPVGLAHALYGLEEAAVLLHDGYDDGHVTLVVIRVRVTQLHEELRILPEAVCRHEETWDPLRDHLRSQ